MTLETIPAGRGGKRPGAGRPSGPKSSVAEDFNAARTRKEAALASLAELDLEVKRGNLIPADVVQEHWTAMAASCRAKMLNLPGRLATSVVGCPTVQEAERVARDLVYECLREMAQPGTPTQ